MDAGFEAPDGKMHPVLHLLYHESAHGGICRTMNVGLYRQISRQGLFHPQRLRYLRCRDPVCPRLCRTEKIISFLHSCYGSTYATASLSACYAGGNQRMHLTLPDIRYFRYFYKEEDLPQEYPYMREIEQAFESDFPAEKAAVLVEPIQGDGGLGRPPRRSSARWIISAKRTGFC